MDPTHTHTHKCIQLSCQKWKTSAMLFISICFFRLFTRALPSRHTLVTPIFWSSFFFLYDLYVIVSTRERPRTVNFTNIIFLMLTQKKQRSCLWIKYRKEVDGRLSICKSVSPIAKGIVNLSDRNAVTESLHNCLGLMDCSRQTKWCFILSDQSLTVSFSKKLVGDWSLKKKHHFVCLEQSLIRSTVCKTSLLIFLFSRWGLTNQRQLKLNNYQ